MKHIIEIPYYLALGVPTLTVAAQLRILKKKLSDEIHPEKDSLRFYVLGARTKSNAEHIGAKPSLDVEDELIF